MKNMLLANFICLAFLSLREQKKPVLIFSDDFKKLDTTVWVTEIDPGAGSSIYCKNGELIMDTKKGVTVWLNKKLSGNIIIKYARTILWQGGANDRVSDCNMFWMASDTRNKNLFTRKGVFESYDSLSLYYLGIGGNSNTTTRFRKYMGNGERSLIKEYKDSLHLLKPNSTLNITIQISGNTIKCSVNDEDWFEYQDTSILRSGYFGFRSTYSRQSVDWIRIYQSN